MSTQSDLLTQINDLLTQQTNLNGQVQTLSKELNFRQRLVELLATCDADIEFKRLLASVVSVYFTVDIEV